MARRSVVTLTVGQKGAGKSWRRGPHFILEEFLPESDGVLWTSIPIFPSKIASAAAAKWGGDESEYLRRLQLIPQETLDQWTRGIGGPWDFFIFPIDGAHIQIDEIHNYCGEHHPKAIRGRWMEWLGEIRHRGATVEFITQHLSKTAKEIIKEAAVKLEVASLEREKFIGVPLGDWWELKASIMGGGYRVYLAEVQHEERMGKWVEISRKIMKRDPALYELYDSFSAPIKGAGATGKGDLQPFERYSRPVLALWFLARNFVPLAWRTLAAAGVVFLISGGGGQVLASFIAPTEAAADDVNQRRTKTKHVEKVKADDAPTVERLLSMPGSPPAQSPADLLRQLEEVRAELTWERAERERLETMVSMSKRVVGVSESAVMLDDGQSYGIGETIEFGPLAGRTVSAIDGKKRIVRLDDGQVLRMGVVFNAGGLLPPSAAGGGSPGSVPGGLPGSGPHPAYRPQEAKQRSEDKRLGSGDAAGRVPAPGGR